MLKSGLGLVCAAVVALSAGVAQADVGGQVFDVDVDSTVSGQFPAELSFSLVGTFTLDAPGGEGGAGVYTQSGAAITFVSATGTNGEGYVGSFVAIATDAKQLPGLLGAIARANRTQTGLSAATSVRPSEPPRRT